MGDEDEKKEIVVKAPSKSVIAPEKKAEKATEKALEEERYNVLQISAKVGKYAGVASTLMGCLLFIFLSLSLITGQELIFLTSLSSSLVVGFWIVVGLVTVIVGFLLLASD